MPDKQSLISKLPDILILTAAIAILLLTGACNSSPAVTESVKQYSITISISPENSGTVRFPGNGIYDAGTEVEIIAAPAPGFEFDYWGGDAAGKTPSTNVAMDSPKGITANFKLKPKNQYRLNISVEPVDAGRVAPPGSMYEEGTELTLEAAPLPGYKFDYWSGDITGKSVSAALIMDGDKIVIAHFKPLFTLKTVIDPVGAGEIKLVEAGDVTPPGNQFVFGTEVTATASPSPGYAFNHWNDARSDARSSQSLVMEQDRTITAHFVPLKLDPIEWVEKGYLSVQASGTNTMAAVRAQIKSSLNVPVEVNIPIGSIFKPSSQLTGIESMVVIKSNSKSVRPGETAELFLDVVALNPADSIPAPNSILDISRDIAEGPLKTLVNAAEFQNRKWRIQQLAVGLCLGTMNPTFWVLNPGELEEAQGLLKRLGIK
jgi:hypothetical protein